MDKALNLLGLARKGGNIELGEEACSGVCRSGRARLLILSADAGTSVAHRAEYFVRGGKPPLLRVSYTKDQLGSALGRNVCPLAALTDVRLALAFVKALGEDERHAGLLETLQQGSDRASKRQQEEKAHKRNLRFGKK